MTDTYTYDVFGATKTHGGTPGTSANAWKYTGELNDTTVGRSPYYLRARYYDPALGRFLSRDPWFANRMNPQSWNRYVYGYNNPALLIDPYGYFSLGGALDAVGKCLGDPEECAKNAGEKVQQGAEAAGDWVSDPENQELIATGVQMVSSFGLPSCLAGGISNPICDISVIGYGGATLAKYKLADNDPERYVVVGTAVLGACGAFANKPVAAAVNVITNALDASTSDPGEVYASRDSRTVVPSPTCPVPIIRGEKPAQ